MDRLSGARGDDPPVPLDVPDRQSNGLEVPAGPGRNISRSYARTAAAIHNGASSERDFGHAVEVHRLLDAVERSSGGRRTIGVGSWSHS